jgi:ubiquinone/menaquinone biosynthesis C-methylase UbiE
MALPELTLPGLKTRLFGPLTRHDAPELMDLPGNDPTELAENLRDIRRVNRFFGGTAVIRSHLPRLLDHVPNGRDATLLDLATGSADIPVAISRWAARRGRAVTIVASDSSAAMLADAGRQIAGHPRITLAQFDARAVPMPDRSFDVVLCSLSLHHFPPQDAVRVLRETARLCRVGFIVNDLRRSRIGYVAAWIASRLGSRNRLTRHDAPLSMRRAYTEEELADLCDRAGITGVAITRHPWFRMAAVLCRTCDGD